MVGTREGTEQAITESKARQICRLKPHGKYHTKEDSFCGRLVKLVASGLVTDPLPDSTRAQGVEMHTICNEVY